MAYPIGPFAKWAGGKKQLIAQLAARMPKKYNRYFEPFVGGGAFLFAVQPADAVINDVNEQLLNVYRQLQADPEVLIDAVKTLDAQPCDRERYVQMRERYNAKIRSHVLDADCAALMIWLNKHCFNGLYRVNSKGLFNVPYNNRKTGASIDEENLRNIANYFHNSRIDIRHGDFEDACRDVQAGDFVYVDSPYVPVSGTANFTDYAKDGFCLEDHERLAGLCKRLSAQGAYVMASNNNVPLVHELYDGFRVETVPVRRPINRDATKRTGQEVIMTSY